MIRRRKQKAAFQLSMGFIIGLIFAVILLTLSIMWIRGVFDQFGSMTDDLTQNAKANLATTFDNSQTNFDVSPAAYKMDPSHSVKLSAGVKNDDDNAEMHTYILRVFPATADASILDAEGCSDPSDIETCPTLKDDMLRWVTYSKYADSIKPNDKGYWDISIGFPQDVKKGNYVLDVVACADSDWASCSRTSPDKWGRTKQLTITAK